jgi:hypothetical protein
MPLPEPCIRPGLMSPIVKFKTCRAVLAESVHRGGPEMAFHAVKTIF